MPNLLRFFLISAASSLVACGGDEVFVFPPVTPGPGPTNPNLSFPFAQGFADFISTTHNYNLSVSGTYGGGEAATGSATMIYTAAVGSTFEGLSAFRQTVAGAIVITIVGVPVPISGSSEYYFTTNYDPLGSSSSDGSDYCVAEGNQAYPTTVKVGDTVTIGTYHCYQDDTKTVATDNEIYSLAVEADTTTTALVTLANKIYTLANTLDYVIEERYRIDESGNINLVSRTLTDPLLGDTTVFTVQ